MMYTLFAILLCSTLVIPAVYAVVTCVTHNILHRSSTSQDFVIALVVLLFFVLLCL